MSIVKSLFKSQESRLREVGIKENLAAQLKFITQEIIGELDEGGFLGMNDTTKALLTALEAVFIHGLKESLAEKFSVVLSDPDAMPKPDFWPLVLVFSHRNIILQIQKLSQITTDIGRCKAWLRLSLNDCLLPSYVDSIINQNSALSPYYKKTAFLRERYFLDMLKKEVDNLAKATFEFPVNSCLLNYWNNAPLLMAGLRTSPMKAKPVAEGMDIASELATEPVSMPIAVPDYASSLEEVLYDEEEARKIILGTPIQDSTLENVNRKENMSCQTTEVSTGVIPIENLGDEPPIKEQDESSAMIQDLPKSSPVMTEQEITPPPPKVDEPPVSYDLLVKDYNPASVPQTSPTYEDLLSRFATKSEEPSPEASPKKSNNDDISEFEIVAPARKNSDLQEFQIMVSYLSKLMVEPGLINQNFACKTCVQLIGLSFGPARVCALTGFYYCEACFNGSEAVLPARILFNWDFNKQLVSGKAAEFLEDIKHHPLLDIRLINPRLYLIVYEMRELQRLRLKLNLLKMYLFTCRVPVIEALKKQLWPREYLYEHVHTYSLSDLLEIPNNNLANLIKEVIKFCENHVFECTLCSQKGFICEVCKSLEIIYPFQIESIFRCTKCNNVIHAKCRDTVDECPKCFRIKKRLSDE